MGTENMLNLGCGKDIKKNFVNVDFIKYEGIDVTHDLNKFPWPFKNNSFKFVIMDRILEHLDNPYEVIKEIYRICKSDARIHIRVPHFSSIHCWGNIQHKRGFSIRTFNMYNLSDMFEVIKQKIEVSHYKFFIKPLVKIFPLFYEKNLAYIFPATDLVVDLRIKK